MSTTVTLRGTPVRVDGDLPATGAKAPDFKLTSGTLADVSLKDFAGKRKVLNIFPSIDTPTCAKSTRKFNEAASGLTNTVVLAGLWEEWKDRNTGEVMHTFSIVTTKGNHLLQRIHNNKTKR